VSKLLKYPKIILGVITILTLFAAFQIPHLTLDNELANFIPDNHPSRIAWEEMDENFGGQTLLSVGLESQYGSIFTPEYLGYINTLTASFEEIPGVEEVTSLSNTDYIYGNDQGMIVEPLMPEDFQGTSEEILEVKKRILNWSLYEKNLVSSDYKATQIIVRMAGDGSEDFEKVYYGVKEVIQQTESVGLEVYLAGNPAITTQITENMKKDLVFLIPLVLIVLILSLFFAFRRLGGVILPLINVVVSTIWTLGLISVMGVPLSIVGTIIPVLMIAVGSAYGIHVVTHYYHGLEEGRTDHEVLIKDTLKRVGPAVILAGITTMAGFGSLTVSQVVPMRTFGIFTAFGVFSALLVSLTLVPALLLIRKKGLNRPGESISMEKGESPILMGLYHHFIKKRVEVLFLFFVALILGIAGTSRLRIDNALIDYFKDSTDIVRSDKFLNRYFTGTNNFYLLVEGEKKGDLTNPEILKAMDDLALYLEDTEPQVSKVLSFSDLIKRMNQSMNIDAKGRFESQNTLSAETGSESSEDSWGNDSWSDDSWGSESLEDDSWGEDSWDSDFSGEDTWEEVSWEDEDPLPAEEESLSESPKSSTGSLAVLLEGALASAQRQDLSLDELTDLVFKELNYKGADYYEIPYDPAKYPVETREELQDLISQYLLLFSGSLDSWSDDSLEPSMARMAVQLLTSSSKEAQRIKDKALDFAQRNFPPGYTIKPVGMSMIQSALTDLIINAQIMSIIASLILVFLILWIYFRSLTAGIIGILPLSLSILINFGVMGFFGITLDISTAMVASIAIGIGIDYTIHFLNSYKRERHQTSDLERVTLRTIKTTGKAISFNAISVGAGFAVLMLSQFNPLNYLGALIALTMFTSSMGAMTLLPILLNLFKPAFVKPEKEIN